MRQIGIFPDLATPADIDETPRRHELPRNLALRLAAAKAEAVAPKFPDALVLGADTVVACGRRSLPKAETEAEARACLGLLSGRRHRVYGGIAIVAPGGRSSRRLVATAVLFKRLTEDEVNAYIASDEWKGKAGGYAIQGRAAAFVRGLVGSYGNVVGLDLFSAAAMLRGLGYKW